jgi:glycogen debranching enzyme
LKRSFYTATIGTSLMMKDASVSQGTVSHVQRRSFLAGAGATAIVSTFRNLFAQNPVSLADSGSSPRNREELSALLRTLLLSDSSALYEFALQAYETCVLGKIRAADPPLAYEWIVPGGGYYAQWLWDTMFVADLLSLLPKQKELIRGVFQNYWDFQQRWNGVKPDFMRGMVANFIAPFDAPKERDGKEWRTFPAYSQAPLLAWGMERVYLRNGDRALLRAGLAPMESFHEWYWSERDITSIGLIGVGAYSGDAQHARYETYDREVDLDGLKMIPHPGRPAGPDNGNWYGNIAIPANTAYLLLSEQCLERMASLLGDHAMAARRRVRHEKGTAAMREHMWDENAGCFLAVNIESLTKVATATVGGFMPLMAHVPTTRQAERMAATLATAAWATPLPIPTVAHTDAQFSSGEFWRGDVWPAPNYQVACGLAAYGHKAAAARIADATLVNAMKVGISERYDSLSGAPLGVAGLGMSATTLTMLLDGLTSSRYTMRAKHDAPRR